MSTFIVIQNQLLATKFFVPATSHPLISRPRLSTLLDESLQLPCTLVSAPAGFGKTMLLSTWGHSLPAHHALLAWVSLDEDDNQPLQFWTNILMAFSMHLPDLFTPIFKYLQSPQTPPLKQVLAILVNLLTDCQEQFVLVLDDYHAISEPQIQSTLVYLLEHLPSQLHLILSTRTDPPLPLALLRAQGQLLEIRTDQLRCTQAETRAFFQDVMHSQPPQKIIEQVTLRTEGWLVGLQLLALSLQGCPDPTAILQEVSGDQRYILDFLTDEVLSRQSADLQTFLLSTCILQRLNASLCDAVTEQTNSQEMLENLEKSNLFLVSLDSKHQWYRYHALFAEALYYRLKILHHDLIPLLHHRASRWYAEHDQMTQAILHAFSAHEWHWAADLIERIPELAFAWGAGEHGLALLQQWLEQLPTEVISARPRLCLACNQALWAVAPPAKLRAWLTAAEARLTASLSQDISQDARRDLEDLLGEVLAFRAFLQGYQEEDEYSTDSLCQQALSLVSPQNFRVRATVASAQFWASYVSSANNAGNAIKYGLQSASLAQAARQTAFSISLMGTTAIYMIATGQLHEAQELTQHTIELGTQSDGLHLPDVGFPMLLQADILREWNQLDTALSLAEEALSLCKQASSLASFMYFFYGHAVLLRIHISRGELEAACSALQCIEHVTKSMNLPTSTHLYSFFTTIDQMRLWLAQGDLKRASRWAETLEILGSQGSPFAHEREQVACVRLQLATAQPIRALERLKPLLARASAGNRWDHVIEIRLLQVRAYQMCGEERPALDVLAEAVRLGEPEGYIRSFVDEGPLVAQLLSTLRDQQRQEGPTPYLDILLAAFPQHRKRQARSSQRTRPRRHA
jgi:LuxR family transcriptional regulator, maltose regulon positive regulatory protein